MYSKNISKYIRKNLFHFRQLKANELLLGMEQYK